jgi:hypothetical protein
VTTNYPDGTQAKADTGIASEARRPTRRLSTETKASYKTTELIAYVVVVVGVLLASQLVGNEDGWRTFLRT